MFVTIGQVKGQTLLPLPPSEITPQEPVVLQDKDKIHILEGAVVTWTRQIKDVLKADSESALKVTLIPCLCLTLPANFPLFQPFELLCVILQGAKAYPGPLTEIDFWIERAANLNSIQQQLSSERIEKVAKVLELVKSTYCPAFNRCATAPSH